MGRIANILDLPIDQRFLIVSMFLTVEYLSKLAVERGCETEEALMEQSLNFVKERLYSGTQISEEKINSSLKQILESFESSYYS